MFKGHPKGLIPAALSNMGERFGYYIMNAVLLLFLCSKFGLSDKTSGVIYSVFYTLIYVLSLVGGIIADRTQNYKGTIRWGLIIMALGYALLSIPILATASNISWLLPFTCVALLLIAFGNGLFKGNLQAIVGQMYDNVEEEAAKKGPEALKAVQGKRDSGFQIFYVFINIGGLVAPFIAPYLREWWLGVNNLHYNAELPALCHQFLNGAEAMTATATSNLNTLVQQVSGAIPADMGAFCTKYLDVFNTGVHYSFIASVAAMLISLLIFIAYQKKFPTPAKKDVQAAVDYTPEEKKAMANEIKQRMYALFAVLGVAVFFWFSFHQNGQSLSVFARDYVKTDAVAPEIWQAINPFFVIVLTPIIMFIFSYLSKKGKEISTPRKIAYGMFIASLAYIFLAIYSYTAGYPSTDEFKAMDVTLKEGMKVGWWSLFVVYFFLTVAELFISPMGLSFVSKVAPKHLQGLCQGLWLGATALGNLMIWLGPAMMEKWPLWLCWTVFIVVCLISMGVMLGMVKWLERVTSDKPVETEKAAE
ncbi:MAG: peptide MFS transporter [Muribaculaceae bacterium]|nr:peptide MFS transporter [Muribaculaceae bacterium]